MNCPTKELVYLLASVVCVVLPGICLAGCVYYGLPAIPTVYLLYSREGTR